MYKVSNHQVKRMHIGHAGRRIEMMCFKTGQLPHPIVGGISCICLDNIMVNHTTKDDAYQTSELFFKQV